MKRLALVLAAAFLGTGCIVVDDRCDLRSVTVSWSGFDGPDASQVDRACASAGVSSVDVWLDGQFVGRWPCSDYLAGIADVGRGTHDLTVEGIDGDGQTILFRDQRTFGASGCGDLAVATVPAAGTVDLNYSFESRTSCAGSSYVWFTLFDVVANAQDPATVNAASAFAQKTRYPCSSTDPVVVLPAGRYELTAITEQVLSSGPKFTESAFGCKLPVAFDVGARAQTTVTPTLADTGTTCLP